MLYIYSTDLQSLNYLFCVILVLCLFLYFQMSNFEDIKLLTMSNFEDIELPFFIFKFSADITHHGIFKWV